MVFLESSSHNPRFNLALEEYVFEKMDQSESYFMLWQNHNAVVVGRYQNTAREVNLPYIEENDITVVRRLSGGGAVYHDLGNLNFTYIVDSGGKEGLDFSLFCQPVADALQRFGVGAEVGGRNDITVEGKKFSGNSQYRKKGRVMHHGTILFDSDLNVVSQALNTSPDKFKGKSVQSVRSRVTSLKPYMPAGITLETFKEQLVEEMFKQNPLDKKDFTSEDIRAVEEIQKGRYDLWDWNWGASPPYSIEKTRRFEGVGSITVFMDIEQGKIKGFASRGDFFSTLDPSGLEPHLLGCKAEKDALLETLKTLPVKDYYHGLTPALFAELLVS